MTGHFVSKPSLSTWGIDEVEANVCEDTFENRQKLTHAGVPFKIFEPGLIEVMFQDYGELNKHHQNQYDAKKIILSDEKNPWSDYHPFDELPLDYMESAPAWIQRHLNKYRDALEAGTPEHKMPVLPKRCRRVRADGSRCWQWAWPTARAEGLCRSHCGSAAFNVGEQMAKMSDAAKMRLSQLQGPALETLEDLILNSTVPHVRLKAATEVLDRTGIRGGTELTVSGQITHELEDPNVVVRERLQALADRLPKPAELEAAEEVDEATGAIIVEGEVVEEERNSNG